MLLVSLKNLNDIWNFLLLTFEVAIKILVFIWLYYQIKYYNKTSSLSLCSAFSVVRNKHTNDVYDVFILNIVMSLQF